MTKNNSFNPITFQLLLWLIIVFEFYTIAGIKVTLLWKAVFLMYIILHILISRIDTRSPVSFMGKLFAVKMLIYDFSNVKSYSLEVLYSIKILSFVLIIEALAFLNKKKSHFIVQISIQISIGIIVVTIPFLLGVLDPTVDVGRNSLARFGYAELYEFIGPFGTKHNASVNLAGALLVIIANKKEFQGYIYTLIYFFLIGIGTYALYKTFVRTGFLVLLLGMVTYFLTSGTLKSKISKIPIISVGCFIGYMVFMNSDILRMRMLDQNIYNESGQVGSGRMVFYAIGLNSFYNSSIPQILLGVGDGHAKEIMGKYIGHGYASHSGFLDILRISGVVGFIIYLIFLYVIFKTLRMNKSNPHTSLLFSLFAGYIGIMAIQGGFYFWYNTLFACYVAHSLKSIKEKKILEKSGYEYLYNK